MNGAAAIAGLVVGLLVASWFQSARVESAQAEVKVLQAQIAAAKKVNDAEVAAATKDRDAKVSAMKANLEQITKQGKANEKRRDAELAAARQRLRDQSRAVPRTSSTIEVRDGADPLEFLIPYFERSAERASEADRVADRLRCAQETINTYRAIHEGRYRVADCGPDGGSDDALRTIPAGGVDIDRDVVG